MIRVRVVGLTVLLFMLMVLSVSVAEPPPAVILAWNVNEPKGENQSITAKGSFSQLTGTAKNVRLTVFRKDTGAVLISPVGLITVDGTDPKKGTWECGIMDLEKNTTYTVIVQFVVDVANTGMMKTYAFEPRDVSTKP
jgi:hypothetical protein